MPGDPGGLDRNWTLRTFRFFQKTKITPADDCPKRKQNRRLLKPIDIILSSNGRRVCFGSLHCAHKSNYAGTNPITARLCAGKKHYVGRDYVTSSYSHFNFCNIIIIIIIIGRPEKYIVIVHGPRVLSAELFVFFLRDQRLMGIVTVVVILLLSSIV